MVATTGIRVDLVFSGVIVVHGIRELKKLRTARHDRVGFAETPTGSGGRIPEKKPDSAPTSTPSRSPDSSNASDPQSPPSAKPSPRRDVDEAIEIVGEPLRVFSPHRRTWTAPEGTKGTYDIVQRTDLNWDKIRTGGDKRGRGLTNAEAARRYGLGPQLDDGFFATLHHVAQDSRGPLVEASTRYHGSHRPLDNALHGQFGSRRPHPTHPVDQDIFRSDTRDYWKWRVRNQ